MCAHTVTYKILCEREYLVSRSEITFKTLYTEMFAFLLVFSIAQLLRIGACVRLISAQSPCMMGLQSGLQNMLRNDSQPVW